MPRANKMLWPLARRLLMGLAILTVTGMTAAAQVIVISSSAPQLHAGRTLTGNTTLEIPAGANVVLILPSGVTRTIPGPYSGRVSELTRGSRSNAPLFDVVKNFIKTGGTTTSNVGAMRSIAPKRTIVSKPAPFSWTGISLTSNGSICVEKGVALTLTRTQPGRAQTVTVVNMNTARRAKVEFGAQDLTAPWPAAVQPENGSFALLSTGTPMRQIRLRLIATLPPTDAILQVLHKNDCKQQLQACLREMVAGGN
ncbi:MAG TPA: hypothetical protein VMX97_02215 [Hyphomicrobiaceae bacterium]|nr:hypothetical protein [Hyphomicrobiaceae bacterium]